MEIRKININGILDGEYSKTMEFFPEIAERINKYRPDDKKRTLAGRYLLKNMIKDIYGREEFSVEYNENGKPLLDFCFFSISHSGGFAVCAVSDSPVGVDIERMCGFKKREKYMLFTVRESEYVNECDCESRFCTLWTRKEALIKAKGGKIADAAKIELVTPDFKLKPQYDEFEFTTKIDDIYILSAVE
ncbi:MAG: 4'-phosphopantetheinyl transferase superfamily protein [Acutalibacteraceae bacterium]|nr:4'-phosphopantetheinyl transferase superfamily protein [Acutalibacteraceae bacterium]